MLSAEHFSLENRAVQQLLDIRQRDIQYLTERFNAIGVQASVIAGFVVSTLTALDPATLEHEPSFVDSFTLYTFWLSSAIALALLSIALLVPYLLPGGLGFRFEAEGSVSRAVYLMTKEKGRWVCVYVFLGLFCSQVMTAFWIIDANLLYWRAMSSTAALGVGVCIVIASLGAWWIGSGTSQLWIIDRMDGNFVSNHKGSQSSWKTSSPPTSVYIWEETWCTSSWFEEAAR